MQQRFAPGQDHQLAAFLRQSKGDLATQADAGPGDQGGFSRQLQVQDGFLV